MIQPTGIDHVVLFVSSLQQSRDYYERVFNFTCAPREGAPDTLAVENKDVHFFLTRDPDMPEALRKRQHISFTVDNLALALQALENMGEQGVATGEVSFFTYNNYAWAEWRDPDGIRVECVQPR